jgi:hypothetical protein
MSRPPTSALAATAALLLSACSSAPLTLAPSTSPTATAGSGSLTLPCQDAIASTPAPTGEVAIILGVVALPTNDSMPRALQTRSSGESDPVARLFAKQGLPIRAGASFELVVPHDVATRLSIGWGNPAHRTRHLVVPGCASRTARLAYAGGYWVGQVGCLPLLVRVGSREQQVRIGVGAPCPRQQPPPQPTET